MKRMRTVAILFLVAAVAAPLGASQPSGGATSGPATSERTHYEDVRRAPWPCWRGPYGNGTAPEAGVELVEDLAEARLVWQSEDRIPHSSPHTETRGGTAGSWGAGYGSPIVAEGKVFLACWRPAGRADWTYTEADRTTHWLRRGRNPVLERTDAAADDVVFCIDAQVGTTLWKRVFPRRGILHAGYKQGCHQTPCYWDGKVYVPGSAGALYCLSAADGRTLWEAKVEPQFAALEACREAGKPMPGGRPMVWGAPAAVDGVVAVSNGRANAFDAETGERRWTDAAPRSLATTGRLMPVVWQHEGAGYFIFGGRMFEARTGRLCWAVPREPEASTAAAVSGDTLVLAYRAGGGQKNERDEWAENGMSGFRISPEKAEPLWQLPMPPPHGAQIQPVSIYKGHVYGEIRRHPDGTPGPNLCCVELETGRIVAAIPRGGFRGGYNPLVADGRFLAMNGPLTMLAAEPSAFRILTERWDGPWSESTSLAYADGFLYFRGERGSDGRLYCYDLRRRPPQSAAARM
jgi:outer membrane protein assembly factor BamB